MGLLDLLRALVSRRGGQPAERETFEYRCRNCRCRFESPDPHVTTASCPNCGSDDIRVDEDSF